MRWHKNGSNTVNYTIETKHKLCKIRIILRSNIDSVLYLGFASKSSNFFCVMLAEILLSGKVIYYYWLHNRTIAIGIELNFNARSR